jgi:hypothetical protein
MHFFIVISCLFILGVPLWAQGTPREKVLLVLSIEDFTGVFDVFQVDALTCLVGESFTQEGYLVLPAHLREKGALRIQEIESGKGTGQSGDFPADGFVRASVLATGQSCLASLKVFGPPKRRTNIESEVSSVCGCSYQEISSCFESLVKGLPDTPFKVEARKGHRIDVELCSWSCGILEIWGFPAGLTPQASCVSKCMDSLPVSRECLQESPYHRSPWDDTRRPVNWTTPLKKQIWFLHTGDGDFKVPYSVVKEYYQGCLKGVVE